MVNNNFKLIGNILVLPKVKGIRIKRHRKIPDHYIVKSASVSRAPTHKYYASILFEYEEDISVNIGTNYIGLDDAMDGLFVSSNNTNASYSKYYRQSLDKVRKESRKLSKMVKGSSNYKK